MDDQFQGTVETDSVVDLIVPVSSPEEFHDAAESELVGHPGVGQSVGVSYSTSASTGVSYAPSVVPGFGAGDHPPVAARGNVLAPGLPTGVAAPVSSTSPSSSEPSGLLSFFSQKMWPSFMTPQKTASVPETMMAFTAHPSTASAARVAPSPAVPAQYRAGVPSSSSTTLSHPPYTDHAYAELRTVTSVDTSHRTPYVMEDPPFGRSTWSASPVGQSVLVEASYPALHCTSPRLASPPVGPPVGATYIQQAAASTSAPYSPTPQSACEIMSAGSVGQSGRPVRPACPPVGATYVPRVAAPVSAPYAAPQSSVSDGRCVRQLAGPTMCRRIRENCDLSWERTTQPMVPVL